MFAIAFDQYHIYITISGSFSSSAYMKKKNHSCCTSYRIHHHYHRHLHYHRHHSWHSIMQSLSHHQRRPARSLFHAATDLIHCDPFPPIYVGFFVCFILFCFSFSFIITITCNTLPRWRGCFGSASD